MSCCWNELARWVPSSLQHWTTYEIGGCVDQIMVSREIDVRHATDENFERFRLAVSAPSETVEVGTPFYCCRVQYGPIDDPITHEVFGEDRMAALENAIAFLNFFASSLDQTHEVRIPDSGRPYREHLLPFTKEFREGLARKLAG